MITKLSLYDTLTRQKKNINLADYKDHPILLYVCGVTPYDYVHIGHARCYVTYDLLVRLIRFFNSKIMYVQNITDVNDKITEKAILKYGDPMQYLDIAEYYHTDFSKSLGKIGCLKPDFLPKVSQSIDEILNLTKNIFEAGYAYETEDGVYFDVSQYPDYGELSNRHLAQKNSNISRIDELHSKEDNLDFALWKKTESLPFWDSRWGRGIPGWHIECSAMIEKSFGNKKINIHGGGIDLIFPHHENEKAQTECLKHHKLADIWMHVAFINFNSEKMSKSKGNCFYIKDILEKYDPMVFRFYLLMHQYNSPIEFNFDSLNSAAISYKQVVNFFNFGNNDVLENRDIVDKEKILLEFRNALFDNLNSALFIGLFFKYSDIIKKDNTMFDFIKKMFKYILGLTLEPLVKKEKQYSLEVLELIDARQKARDEKDFVKADEIKKILISMGVPIHDKKI